MDKVREMFQWLKLFLPFAVSILLIGLFFPSPAKALFTITETQIFATGPYAFKLQIQVNGHGNFKKPPVTLTSVKVKIKNDRASSDVLRVKTIRAYLATNVFQDIETAGYPISAGQWVTKFYRIPKGKRPLLSDKSYIEVTFEGFAIQFYPKDRKFHGPAQRVVERPVSIGDEILSFHHSMGFFRSTFRKIHPYRARA